jgi:nitroimidazol reductase NimA-like FMN-containing flavoprotein (pyridoxamine 5'-phosphate oxidase superfamily)
MSPPAASLTDMALSKEEREQFLAEPHIAALSVYAGDGRGPLTVPIWYQYSPGGEPWVLTGLGSRKHRLIEAAGYFALMAERVTPTVRYVSVDGPVSRIESATDEQLVELTKRYLAPEKVEPYLEFARREQGESVVIHLRPQHWLSADLGEL